MRQFQTLVLGLSFITTGLFGQNSESLLSKTEWMFIGKGFNKHYLFKFKDGLIKSEFDQGGWSSYTLDNEQLVIQSNSFGQNTAIFQITKLNNDSLVLNPVDSRAKEFSYYLNRKTFRLDSNSFKTSGAVKFYNRQLSYRKVQFDSLTLNYFDKSFTSIDSKGNYTIKKRTKGKSNPKIQRMTQGQLDQLLELLNKSNINYFKSSDKFESRTKDWGGLKLKLIDNGESIKINTDDNELPWTIRPLVDFIVSLSKD